MGGLPTLRRFPQTNYYHSVHAHSSLRSQPSSEAMKHSSTSRFFAAVALTCASFTLAASAGVVVSGETNDDVGFTVSSTDLLQTYLASTTDNISLNTGENNAIGGSAAFLNDGSFGALGASGGVVVDGGSITYQLATSGPTGFDISAVNVYTGWNDPNRDGHNYTVSYSTVADPGTFIDIATVTRDEAGRFEKSSVTEDAPPNLLATNVKAIRITFNPQENGGVGYKEIDVIGSSPVPTPRNLTWNNGDLSGLWNSTDANWTGSIWNSALPPDNAFFTSVGGNISLDPGTAAGSVNVGNAGIQFASLSLLGGDLTAATLTVQGLNSNNGDYGSNPTLSIGSNVTISGDAAIGRANLNIIGGTLAANRIITSPASGDWGRLVVAGGTVTTNNGVDGSVYSGGTFAVELNGGTLETPSLRVANRDLDAPGLGGNNDANLLLNGGTLKAIGTANPNFITLYGDEGNGANPSQAIYIGSGGAIIDTNGLNTGIQVNLADTGGGGGLTKLGAGTLTLSGTYNHTGPTVVEAGTLELSTATLSDTAIVDVASTAVLKLPDASIDTVADFLINGVSQGPGTWNSANTGGRITGGSLVVVAADPFLAWIDTYYPNETDPLIIGATADPDNDGIENILEYVLQGGDPSASNPGILPAMNASGADFVFTYNRRTAATGTTQTFQHSPDLGATPWTELAIPGGAGVVVGEPSGGIEQVQITVAKGTNTKLFGRLKVSKP
jgi:autotransporter-associated beta strand protein